MKTAKDLKAWLADIPDDAPLVTDNRATISVLNRSGYADPALSFEFWKMEDSYKDKDLVDWLLVQKRFTNEELLELLRAYVNSPGTVSSGDGGRRQATLFEFARGRENGKQYHLPDIVISLLQKIAGALPDDVKTVDKVKQHLHGYVPGWRGPVRSAWFNFSVASSNGSATSSQCLNLWHAFVQQLRREDRIAEETLKQLTSGRAVSVSASNSVPDLQKLVTQHMELLRLLLDFRSHYAAPKLDQTRQISSLLNTWYPNDAELKSASYRLTSESTTMRWDGFCAIVRRLAALGTVPSEIAISLTS